MMHAGCQASMPMHACRWNGVYRSIRGLLRGVYKGCGMDWLQRPHTCLSTSIPPSHHIHWLDQLIPLNSLVHCHIQSNDPKTIRTHI